MKIKKNGIGDTHATCSGYVVSTSAQNKAVSSSRCGLETKSAQRKELLNYKQSVEIGHYGGGML